MILGLKSYVKRSQNSDEKSQMAVFDKNFVIGVLPEAVISGNFPLLSGPWVIDSRKVVPGSVFVALKGKTTDGHLFIADAITQGAVLILMDNSNRTLLDALPKHVLEKSCFVFVESPETALVRLAAAWRAQFSIPIVGITGSLGKTSTKELVVAMANAGGKRCHSSLGNYNTVLGAAMTLLGLHAGHDCAVLEMGISERGEMASLAELIRPTIGVITTIAHQHIDGLGSLQNIAAEKRAIFTHFQPDFIGIINGDQPLLSGVSYPHPVVRFGYKLTNQVQARRVVIKDAQITCLLKLYSERYQLTLPTPHKGLLLSALAAASVAYFLGIPGSSIIEAIEKMPPVRGRFRALPLARFKGVVIDDAYNASPESVREGILAFDRLDFAGKKIAVLGDMLALGEQSTFWHRQIGRFLRKTSHIDQVVLVGDQIRAAEKTMPRWITYQVVPRWEDAQLIIEQLVSKEESVVFVKGSHDVGLHQLVNKLIA